MADLVLEQTNSAHTTTELIGTSSEADPFVGNPILRIQSNMEPGSKVDAVHAFGSQRGRGLRATGLKGVVGEGSRQDIDIGGPLVLGIGVEGDGDDYGVVGYGVRRDQYGVGVLGSGPLSGVTGFSPQGVAIYGNTNGPGKTLNALAGLFEGDVQIDGSLVVTQQKSAAVPFPDGTHRLLYALESPECWFEDFGEAQLVEGKATVRLAPDFARVTRANAYHVFLTPCGDSNGLFVFRRSARSFQVREQKKGRNTLAFSYRIVAKRRDRECGRFAQVKLHKMPKDILPRELETPNPSTGPHAQPAARMGGGPEAPRPRLAKYRSRRSVRRNRVDTHRVRHDLPPE